MGQLFVTELLPSGAHLRHLLRRQSIKVLLHFGGGEDARRHPGVAQLTGIYFGGGHVRLEAQSFTHRDQLLVVDGVILPGTFARLTGFSVAEEKVKEAD